MVRTSSRRPLITPTANAIPLGALHLPLSADGRLRRLALLSALGLSFVAVTAPRDAAANPPAFGTPASIAVRSGVAPRPGASASPSAAAIDAARGTGSVTTLDQATARSQRSVANLSRAAEAIASARSGQRAAAAIALGTVPNGLGAGGLQVAAGVGSDPTLWQNSELPTQTVAGARTTVTVEQTDSRAIMSWDSFNVGRDTTLHIDQSGGDTTSGSNDWVALNRVTSSSASPSQILGTVKAEGSVYLINNNGIVFGAGSQVDSHSLIATSLNLYNNDRVASDRTFLDANQGITRFTSSMPIGSVPAGSVLVDPAINGGAAGSITVERGAAISTGTRGFSLLAAPEVSNAGTIKAVDGQAIIAGARNLVLEEVGSDATRNAVRLQPYTTTIGGAEPPPTRAVNSGLIEAARGNVTMLARDVAQDGVIAVTTGIASPGSITLTSGSAGVDSVNGGLAGGRVRFGQGSVTTILPDLGSETTTSSAAASQTFKPGRIELVSNSIEFGPDSLLVAPGARIDVRADGTPDLSGGLGIGGRIYVGPGAIIDVSGLTAVRSLAGTTLVTVARIGQNELANSPVQRDSFLFRQSNVVIDGRLSGIRADGTPWVGSPLLNASGLVDQVPRAISELLVNAGSISATGAQFITASGSLLNLDGGYRQYGDATRGTTRVQTRDGHLVSIGAADPLRGVSGFAGQYAILHRRWSTTRTWTDPIIGGNVARFVPKYLEGGNAGSLKIALLIGDPGLGNGLVRLDGTISAQALAGREQVAAARLPSGGRLQIDTLAALVIADPRPDPGTPIAVDTAITSSLTPQDRNNPAYWTTLSGEPLAEAGFTTLALSGAQIVVEAGRGLNLQPGGSLSLSGARVRIDADLRTAGGSISIDNNVANASTTGITFVTPDSRALPTTRDIVIGSGVTLSTRGRFVNDAFVDPEQRLGSAFIDGGRIVLISSQSQEAALLAGTRGGTGDQTPQFGDALDNTGNIRLETGSRLDVGSGAYVDGDGRLSQRNVVPAGKGGDISLLTYPRNSAQAEIGTADSVQAEVGRIIAGDGDLRSHLQSYGFRSGGTLSLRALGFQIGGSVADSYEGLHLAADFFSDQGFADYRLSSAWDATIAADSTVRISHRNLIAEPLRLADAATGSALLAAGTGTPPLAVLGSLDDSRRSPTHLNLVTGDFINTAISNPDNNPRDPSVSATLLVDAGAAIVADAEAHVQLASINQLTVLGRITAHGGSISLSGDSVSQSSAIANGLAPPADPNILTYASLSKSVWLGADSLLDVSGITVLDPLAALQTRPDGSRSPLRSGRVLDGGSVTLSNDSGYIVALEGARIDASGVSDRLDLLTATGSPLPGQGYRYTGRAANVWSDGGSIRIGAAGGLLFDGSLRAAAGSAQARGGSLSITALNSGDGSERVPSGQTGTSYRLYASARSLILHQSGRYVPFGLLPGEDIESGERVDTANATLPSGDLNFSLDRLAGSGIDNLSLGQDPVLGNMRPGLTIAFAGEISLTLPGTLTLAAHRYRAVSADTVTVPVGDGTPPPAATLNAADVRLAAATVSFGGYSYNGRNELDTRALVNDARLTVRGARGIDLVGNTALQNFAEARFETDGDLRLYTPVGRNQSRDGNVTTDGSLYSSGNLTFAAAQLYPASGNLFQLVASAPASTLASGDDTGARTIRFEQTTAAPSRLPLSAGGALLVDAANIEQAGTLRAPSGQIVLGIADPASAATQARFGRLPIGVNTGSLPLVATLTLSLLDGSETSVSSAGLVVPYGFTVDGRELQYDAMFGSQQPASASLLANAPAKQVLLNGVDVSVGEGATVDLSGGGDLQAQEFIPGTGGTRDVLATRFTAPGSSTPSSLFPDGREVYAILPGISTAAGVYDPAIDAGGEGALVGRSVHLSGVGALPEGDYILLPARYATLPGAYRVVQDTATLDSISVQNTVLDDGSYLSAGYFQDSYARLDGSIGRDARSSRFVVQRGEVWQQYSQYQLTSANDYFTDRALDAGRVASLRPLDAGQLVLAASGSLAIDGRLAASGGRREVATTSGATRTETGASAQVDIAARNIQIVGQTVGDAAAATALDGFVALDSRDLDRIGAASLLIGGTRSQSAAGTVVDTVASRIVVDNDAGSALTGAELILVASGTPAATGEEQEAAIELRAGSVIASSATAFTGSGAPLLLSGDGALLRVSSGDAVAVQRSGTSASGGAGILSIAGGARIGGGSELVAAAGSRPAVLGARSLTLDNSAGLSIDPTAGFAARYVDANASSINLVAEGSDRSTLDGLVLGRDTLAQFGASERLALVSRGALRFIGSQTLSLGNTALSLTAARYVGDGRDVGITARQLVLNGTSTLADAVPTTAAGRLSLNLGELVLGAGQARYEGFADLTARVSDRVLASGSSVHDFGSADVVLATPLLTATTGTAFALATRGALQLDGRSATAASVDGGIGGQLSLTAASLRIDTRIAARSGVVALASSAGDLRLGGDATISVAGIEKTFYDVRQYASAGTIRAVATGGVLGIDTAATLDFAASARGGDAGRVELRALDQDTAFASTGVLLGSAASGYHGGRYSLDVGNAVALDSLAVALAASGATDAISIHSRSGNLELAAGNTLSARDLRLTADATAIGSRDGNIVIAGTLDASGVAGGSIALNGLSGVDVPGRLLATGSRATERGGSVSLATGSVGSGLDGRYGYQTVGSANAGSIRLGPAAVVDVSGGSAGGLEGGTLNLRSALLDNGDVNIAIDSGTTIRGAREVAVEAYAVWSTADGGGFDGNIDPRGNAGFYVNTLQGFLQQGPLAFETRLSGVPAIRSRLGIELRNPDGDINVVSNWNLGAVELDGNGNVGRSLYRHSGDAPVLSLRAAGAINVGASISDGFVQLSNPLGLQAPRARNYEQVQALYAVLGSAYPALAERIDAPTRLSAGTPDQQARAAQYYGLYEQYLNYLLYGRLPVGRLDAKPNLGLAPATRIETLGVSPLGLGAPTAPLAAQAYASYLLDYDAYLTRTEGGVLNPRVALPAPPRPTLAPLFTGAALAGAGGVDNSASPQSTTVNPLPLAAASLSGGASSSYRLVSGADTGSADVLGLRALDGLTAADLVISGNSGSYTDPVTMATTVAPTMIRTGSGSIALAVGRDFVLADATAPGVVYTAGTPRTGTVADSRSSLLQPALYDGAQTSPIGTAPVGQSVISGFVQPEAAGDLQLSAQRDILGGQSTYSNSGSAGQFWWSWLDTGNDLRYSLDSVHNGGISGLDAGSVDAVLASSINFGSFGQGLMSVGGNVDIRAGQDIAGLSVSLPTTWYLGSSETGRPAVITVGGGNLKVDAGRDLLGGSYFVARGEGRLRAEGRIGADPRSTLDTILATQDGLLDVAARGDVAIAGVYNPAYIPPFGFNSSPALLSSNSQAYSARSAVSIAATTGSLRFGTLSAVDANTAFGLGFATQRLGEVLPATVSLTAFDGSLRIEKAGGLYPSAIGNLSLYADDSIAFTSRSPIDQLLEAVDERDDRYFGLIDADPANLPNPLNQVSARRGEFLAPSLRSGYRYISSVSSPLLHARSALHADDTVPARVYALNGDIVGGRLDQNGILRDALVLAPDKQTLVQAGRDIVNLSFQGQHVHDSDVSRIVAGRDLLDTSGGTDESVTGVPVFGSEPSIVIAGPGELQLEAGRDVGPFTNQNQIIDGRSRPLFANDPRPAGTTGTAPVTGIVSIGNLYNPFLPRDGAAISLLFGVGPGVATEAFIERYIDPAGVGTAVGVRSYAPDLVRFIQRYQQGLAVNTGFVRDAVPLPAALAPDAAYALFRALPDYVQRQFVGEVFFDVLATTGRDFGNPDSLYNGQYARGYQAIEALFPSALGYTANKLAIGGANGAALDAEGRPIVSRTGDLDLRGTTLQSQQGGTISIFGPGGEALIGSTAAPSVATDAQGRLFAGPGTQGILSLDAGDIRIFTDRSLLLAQSRVFTEAGGDIVIWSSNADINAGRGARTTAELPLPAFLCNLDFYCLVDARGAVSGAGIATLQNQPGAQAGDVLLVAPAGTVDAGDAGIRVSGNLIVAARAVANADNVQVQGSSIGLRLSAIDSGTLSAGSGAAAAAGQQAAALASRPVDRAATVITVEVQGFGTPDEEQKRRLQH